MWATQGWRFNRRTHHDHVWCWMLDNKPTLTSIESMATPSWAAKALPPASSSTPVGIVLCFCLSSGRGRGLYLGIADAGVVCCQASRKCHGQANYISLFSFDLSYTSYVTSFISEKYAISSTTMVSDILRPTAVGIGISPRLPLEFPHVFLPLQSDSDRGGDSIRKAQWINECTG